MVKIGDLGMNTFLNDLKLYATRSLNDRVSHIHKLSQVLKEDPDQEKRMNACMCKLCYYKEDISGRAITKSICKCCSDEMVFPSTTTHQLCHSCAKTNDMCSKCGADLSCSE